MKVEVEKTSTSINQILDSNYYAEVWQLGFIIYHRTTKDSSDYISFDNVDIPIRMLNIMVVLENANRLKL